MRSRFKPAGPPAREARGRRGGIGRSSSEAAERVSDDLRRVDDPSLARRRAIVRLSLLGTGSLGMVASYQTGLLSHLPDPPFGPFDSDRVDASGEAYRFGLMPDSILGILSTMATAALASAGASDRGRTQRWLPLLLGGKVLVDAAWAIGLTAEQATKHRRYCFWCLITAATQVAAVPYGLAEARAALRSR